jgi:hypothetical protein
VLVADNPPAFAEAVVRLSTDEFLWSRLRHSAREQMAASHGPLQARQRLRQALSVFLAGSADATRSASADGGRAAPLDWTSLPGLWSRSQLIVAEPGERKVLGADDRVWSLLEAGDEGPAGYYPADDRAVIARLEKLRSRGGDFLLLTGSTRWWLDHYPELRRYLARCRTATDDGANYVLYDLRTPRDGTDA